MSNHAVLAATLALLFPAVASAQSSPRSDGNRPSLVFSANGGGYSPVTDLNSSGAQADLLWTGGLSYRYRL